MAGAPQQSNQSDNSMAALWIVGAMLVFISIIWVTFKKYLILFYFKVKLFEIDLLSYFTHHLDDTRTFIQTADPTKLTFQEVVMVGSSVGEYIRFPLVMVLMILAFLLYFSHRVRVFKHIYTMQDLVQVEKTNWPQINPVANLDLLHTDIDKGPWAMALTPMQFCKRYHLLEEYQRGPQEGLIQKEWSRIEVKLKRGEANKIFASQLGILWPGGAHLPPHVKALFAAFAARINGDTNGAAQLLTNINRSIPTKLNFSGTEELLKKHENTKHVQQIVRSHAYMLTLMASMLLASREDGVQASADFLWLKPVDRRFWYMLNTVGRQTAFVEVGGVYAHWLAERALGKPLVVPMIEEATHALEIAIKEVVYRPDEASENG